MSKKVTAEKKKRPTTSKRTSDPNRYTNIRAEVANRKIRDLEAIIETLKQADVLLAGRIETLTQRFNHASTMETCHHNRLMQDHHTAQHDFMAELHLLHDAVHEMQVRLGIGPTVTAKSDTIRAMDRKADYDYGDH